MSTRDVMYNEDLDSRVHQIIANSASNLVKGMSIPGASPFKYVKRRHDKVKACINSVTALEHLWGIFAMLKDPATSSSIKPALLNRVDEILDDCPSYDWETAVWPWSEEVFSLIAEGRLLRGWDDVNQIQMLRLKMSMASTAKLGRPSGRPSGQPQEHANKPRAFQQQYGQQSNQDQLKGGPPCPSYNSAHGCHLPSGHMQQGKK